MTRTTKTTAIMAALAALTATAHAAGTPSSWPMYAMQPGHNAALKSSFPAVAWHFEVPGAATARKSVKNPTIIRDLVGFPIGVALVDGAVYAPNDNGFLYKLDARTGRLLWSFNAYNQLMTTPVVATVGSRQLVFVGAGNSVFAFSHAGKFAVKGAAVTRGTDVSAVDAVDAATGALVWSYTTKGEDMPSAAFANGTLMFGNGDGHVYALDAATGALKWRTPIKSFVSMSSATFDPRRNILIMGGTHPSNIYALDAATGKRLWTIHPDHIFSSSGGDGTWAVAGNAAIGQIEIRTPGQTTTSSSEELAIDLASGKILWSRILGTGKTPPRNKDAVPAIAGGIIYTGSPVTHDEYAIDAATGAIRWTQPLKIGMKAAPTIVGNDVIQPTGNGTIFTLARSTGKILHTYNQKQGGYGPQNGVAIGGTYFIGTNSGVMQAIPLRTLAASP